MAKTGVSEAVDQYVRARGSHLLERGGESQMGKSPELGRKNAIVVLKPDRGRGRVRRRRGPRSRSPRVGAKGGDEIVTTPEDTPDSPLFKRKK